MTCREGLDASGPLPPCHSSFALWPLGQRRNDNPLWVTQIALVGLGRFEESERIGEELEPLAERLGHVGALMVGLRCRGMREVNEDR